MVNSAFTIEMTKTSAVVFMKARRSKQLKKNSRERWKNLFFKAPNLANIKINRKYQRKAVMVNLLPNVLHEKVMIC